MFDLINRFHWENDTWYWELLRLSDLGLPHYFDCIVVPDKLVHALMVFFLAWTWAHIVKRLPAVIIGWSIMMGPWEIIWDGCYRGGASWKDMIANTLGGLLCYWWLGNKKIGQAKEI